MKLMLILAATLTCGLAYSDQMPTDQEIYDMATREVVIRDGFMKCNVSPSKMTCKTLPSVAGLDGRFYDKYSIGMIRRDGWEIVDIHPATTVQKNGKTEVMSYDIFLQHTTAADKVNWKKSKLDLRDFGKK